MNDAHTPDRYDRQMLLPDFGREGQERLGAGHVLIVGCGALGTAAAQLLARAGVGRLTLVDRDLVELTNLQRQVLFTEEDARRALPKAEAARRRLAEVNGDIQIRAEVADVSHRSIERLCLADRPDVIVDGTDNFETRYLLNDLAVREGLPFVYGGAVGTGGMSMTIRPGVTPCLRCLFEDPPAPGTMPTCDTAGVLAPVTAIVGAVQACETMKLLLGRDDLVSTTLLEFDPWHGARRRLDLSDARRDDCPCCAQRRFVFLDGGAVGDAVRLCGGGGIQFPAPADTSGVDLDGLAKRLEPHGSFTANEFVLRGRFGPGAVRSGQVGLTVFRDGRVLVHGIDDVAEARTIHARFVGS